MKCIKRIALTTAEHTRRIKHRLGFIEFLYLGVTKAAKL